jgi:hypothetical protein
MPTGKASCVYRGNTFYCDYDVSGSGSDREVRVRYNGEELSTRTNGRPDEAVAEALLDELVTLEAISMTVVEGSVHGRVPATRSDARDRRAA